MKQPPTTYRIVRSRSVGTAVVYIVFLDSLFRIVAIDSEGLYVSSETYLETVGARKHFELVVEELSAGKTVLDAMENACTAKISGEHDTKSLRRYILPSAAYSGIIPDELTTEQFEGLA